MRRCGLVPVLLGLALSAGVGVAAQRAAGDDEAAIKVAGKDGAFIFTPTEQGDGKPCLAFDTPTDGGAMCFVAVGSRGGWALEADRLASTHDVVVYGVAVRDAARIRVGKAVSLRTLPYSKRFKVRFFAGLVPRTALHTPPNSIVALDARGHLLGRQHYNDGHGHFGRCDGTWDRKHYCAKGRGD
jgi:hypothetical protein